MKSLFATFTTSRMPLPPELASEQSLLNHLGLSARELNKIWWCRNTMYHTFEFPKKNGKFRAINAPDERLKYLQRKICILLNEIYHARSPVHGFVTDKSVKTNAEAHLRKRFVLNIDLKDFFPSITENRVKGVLISIGINERVAIIIARICCYESYLPQGAPTSPILSNMICFRLDKDLLAFAKKARCIYTRYADDLTLSSYQPMTVLFNGTLPPAGHFAPDILSEELRNIIVKNGFEINPDKAHYADKNSRKMVTGIKINEILNVDRRYVRNIRAALYSVKILGVTEAQKKFQSIYGGQSNIDSFLHGKITWLRYIRGHNDPVFRSLAKKFNQLFPKLKMSIMPTKEEIIDRAVWVVEHINDNAMCQGSAFFLKDTGLITSAHCVKEAKGDIEIYHPSKPSNKFKVLINKIDSDRDLAILSHSMPPTEYFELNISSLNVSVGDDLKAVGYPNYGLGDRQNIRNGTVTSLPTKHAIPLIEVSQTLAQGMSGGPLIDNTFAVIGVIHKGGPKEDRDFAIHIKELIKWIKP